MDSPAQATQGTQAAQAADHRIERHVVQAIHRLAMQGHLPLEAQGLGLNPGECAALLHSLGESLMHDGPSPEHANPAPLLQPLVALLWQHRAHDDAWTRLTAGAIGSACFGEHHLWQDLDLSGRSEVSALLKRHFPALAAGNTRGLRWKRYLFLRLGDTLGIEDLKPPRCDGCDDFQVCFPPAGEPASSIAIKRSV